MAADGVIKTKIEGNYGIILEVNCQTDFVAKDAGFGRSPTKCWMPLWPAKSLTLTC